MQPAPWVTYLTLTLSVQSVKYPCIQGTSGVTRQIIHRLVLFLHSLWHASSVSPNIICGQLLLSLRLKGGRNVAHGVFYVDSETVQVYNIIT